MLDLQFVKDGNDLCSDFLEINRNYLDFYSSWSALMQVVDEIEQIRDDVYGWFLVSISGNGCSIQSKDLWKAAQGIELDHTPYFSNPDAIFETKLESTFYNVVEFIKFYNENIKK